MFYLMLNEGKGRRDGTMEGKVSFFLNVILYHCGFRQNRMYLFLGNWVVIIQIQTDEGKVSVLLLISTPSTVVKFCKNPWKNLVRKGDVVFFAFVRLRFIYYSLYIYLFISIHYNSTQLYLISCAM